MFIAQVKFSAEVDGKTVVYRKGDKITEEAAKKLGLADKPKLATQKQHKPTE